MGRTPSLHGLITTEPAPEGAAVEWSEDGGEDEGAGWDAEAGEAGAHRAPAPGGASRVWRVPRVCLPCASCVLCALCARAWGAMQGVGRGAAAVAAWGGGGGWWRLTLLHGRALQMPRRGEP